MPDQYVQVSLPATLDYTHPQLVFIAARWNAAEQPLLVLPRSVCRFYGRSPVKLSSGLSDPDPQGVAYARARLLSIEHLVPTTNHFDVNVSWLTFAVEVSPSTNFTRCFALRRRDPRKRKVTSCLLVLKLLRRHCVHHCQ
jgi:hypothetical protein